jgi:succinate dehydrogenase/fumarate reductase cytochrome b subunit
MRIVRKVHRLGAVVVALFVLVHLANHLAALGGIAAHLRFMDGARLVYRQPVVETLLLLAVVVQAGNGLRLLGAAGRDAGDGSPGCRPGPAFIWRCSC